MQTVCIWCKYSSPGFHRRACWQVLCFPHSQFVLVVHSFVLTSGPAKPILNQFGRSYDNICPLAYLWSMMSMLCTLAGEQ